MTNRHAVPSEDFWTITPFSFETPDGWTARQTATHLAYMEVPDEPGTNCGILWKRVSRKLDLSEIARMAQTVLAATDPNAEVGVSKRGELNGRPAYVRIAELTVGEGDDATRKGQFYTAFSGPGFGEDRPVELFEIIGHFDVANAHRLNEISEIVASFRFDFRPRAVAESAESA